MADNLSFNGKIQVQMDKLISDLHKAITETAEFAEKANLSSKTTDRLEKSLLALAASASKLSSSMSSSGNVTRAQTTQLNAQQNAVQGLITQYNSLKQAQGVMSGRGLLNQQDPLMAQKLKTTTAEYHAQVKAQTELGNAIQKVGQTQAQVQNETRNSSAFRTQRQELDSLRTAIQARYAMQDRLERDHGTALRMNAVESQRAAERSYGANVRASQQRVRDEAAYSSQLASTSYALYDVAQTWTMISAATLGAAVAAQSVAAQYESILSQVQRTSQTSGDTFGKLSQDLIDLSTAIPTSFSEIGSIATLAGQLGVASDSISEFTGVVAKFAATTDVTAEAAATGIGRVAQLTGTAASEYENLASAIYQTGITSVATESAILSTATQISTAGNLAGFANTEIVALASAFASLGVAPERARGSVQRIFGGIEAATSEGGESLQQFADIAGMSASEFASAWEDAPQKAFNALLEGFHKVSEAGGDTNALLKDIGLGNVRDIQSIQVLANNMEVYTEAQEQSNSAYAEGTALANGYALIADDLISKLKALGNTAKAIVAEIGNMPGLKLVVDAFQQIAGALLNLVRVPAIGWIGGIMVGLAGVVGIFAAFQGGLALTRASILRLVQAQQQMSSAAIANSVSLRAAGTAIVQLSGFSNLYTAATARATAGTAAFTASLGAQSGAAARATASMAATRAMSTGLMAGLAGAAKFGAIGLGIAATVMAVSALESAFDSAGEKATEFFGGLDGLSEALRTDTKAYEEAGGASNAAQKNVATFSAKVKESSTDLNENSRQLGLALDTQIKMSDSTATTTESLESQNFAVGENTKQWALNALTTGEAGDKMTEWYTKYGKVLEGTEGFSLKGAFDAAMDPENGGADAYLEGVIAKYDAIAQKATAAIAAEDVLTEAGAKQAAVLQAQVDSATAASTGLNQLKVVLGDTSTALTTAATEGEAVNAIASAMGVDVSAATDEMAGLEGGLDGVGTAADEAATKMQGFIDNAFGNTDNIAAVEDALYNLGGSLRDNGNSFSTFTEGGRANLEALKDTISTLSVQANGDAAVFGASIGNLLTDLEGYGVDTKNELAFVHEMMSVIGRTTATGVVDVDTSAAQAKLNNLSAQMQVIAGRKGKTGIFGEEWFAPLRKNMGAEINELNKKVHSVKKPTLEVAQAGITMGDSMKNGFDKADRAARDSAGKQKKAADQTKEALRTLVDYASDIGGVVSRAFDIRFGAQQGEDDIASQYEKISKTASDAAKSIEDANQKIREIDASLGTLRASNKTLEYQLRVAIEYGDELRATEIRAKMGENNAEIAGLGNDRNGAVIDLRSAQDAASMSLTGNTAAARENRDTVLGLVQSYQKQIQTLAASGLSTDELARRTEELRQDFVRQLTQLGYNRQEIDRYARGFDDLAVAIRNVPRNVTVTADVNPAQQAVNEFMARNANKSLSVGLSATGGGVYQATGINVGGGGINTPTIEVRNIVGAAGSAAINVLKAMGFSEGGYTGRGGKQEVAGIVHKGEYVVPANQVDQNTGLPYQNALSTMLPSQSVSHTTINNGSNAAIQLVEILPNQIREIVSGMNVTVEVDGRQLAGTVNSQNSNSSTRGNA